MSAQLAVGRIGKPHGIRGEVTVRVLTDEPEERFQVGEVFDAVGEVNASLTLRSARWNNGILLLGFVEIADRHQAEALRGTLLLSHVSSERVHDQWYEHELQGLAVRVGSHQIGQVRALHLMPSQDLLVVQVPDGADVLVPFVREIVPEVSLPGGYIRLDPPEGLFSLNR